MPVTQKKVIPKNDKPNPSAAAETLSEADVFDAVKPRGEIAPAKYEAIIVSAVLQEPDANGRSARITYEIASEGDYQGQTITQFYRLIEADGKTAGKGAQFLKADLTKLGQEDVKFADLPEVFKVLEDQHIGCVITVRKSSGYTNAFLGGLAEGSDAIDKYIELRAF